MTHPFEITSPEAMLRLGEQLALHFPEREQGWVIYLSGPLGAGKTTFSKGFLMGRGYKDNVKSPTYTLVESYDVSPAVHHFDFYRIQSPLEIEFLGIESYFENTFCLIEWAEKGLGMLPQPDLTITFDIKDTARTVTLTAHDEALAKWLGDETHF